MRYSETKPRYPLSRFVECFWRLESDAPSSSAERILPDGCIELILNFGAEFSQHCEEHRELAIECGYYDQAHLIRDFHQFARQTPAVLFGHPSAITESFTRKARKSDFYNTIG